MELKCTVPVGHPSDTFFSNAKKVRCVVNNGLCVPEYISLHSYIETTFHVKAPVKLSTTGVM